MRVSFLQDMKESNVEKAKLVGSGETAARFLAKNGVAIKISQDGTIKIFVGMKKITIKLGYALYFEG